MSFEINGYDWALYISTSSQIVRMLGLEGVANSCSTGCGLWGAKKAVYDAVKKGETTTKTPTITSEPIRTNKPIWRDSSLPIVKKEKQKKVDLQMVSVV